MAASDHIQIETELPAAMPRRDGEHLDVTLPSGARITLLADRLREACRCAYCRRARIEGAFRCAEEPVLIESCATIGHYGVNIAFSDGHARGIYPWAYLAELASR
jgi:prepilin-type processing-associated H-X9-DG protein